MEEWTPAFRPEYRERARALSRGGIDIEASYRAFLTRLLGNRAHEVHERSMRGWHTAVREPVWTMSTPALTARQLQVVDRLAQGVRPPEIAVELGISEAAARDRVKKAQQQLGARTAAQVVAIAIRSGQVRPQAA